MVAARSTGTWNLISEKLKIVYLCYMYFVRGQTRGFKDSELIVYIFFCTKTLFSVKAATPTTPALTHLKYVYAVSVCI